MEVNSGVNHAVFFIMGVHTKPRWWIISGIGYISCQEGAGPCIQGESKDGCRSFGSKQAIYVYGFTFTRNTFLTESLQRKCLHTDVSIDHWILLRHHGIISLS